MVDPGMVIWARVALLNDHPRRYELVRAFRILVTQQPQVYRPRLARAIGDLVDGFSDAAPEPAIRALVAEAAGALDAWARELVRMDTAGVLDEVVVRPRRRRAADRDGGPDWDLLAAAVALAEAGRGDAALAVTDELIAVQRGRRDGPPSRLGLALLHRARLLERRERSPEAATVRAEGLRQLGTGPRPRSNAIAVLLTGIEPPAPPKVRPGATGGAAARTPLHSR